MSVALVRRSHWTLLDMRLTVFLADAKLQTELRQILYDDDSTDGQVNKLTTCSGSWFPKARSCLK